MSTLQSPPIEYPESDGKPMADNTTQRRYITRVKSGLDIMYAKSPNVFVAGDLLWYPVEGRNDISFAPDAMVAIGRPAGDRGSYKQWEEGGQPPNVAFEIWSPSNTAREMAEKCKSYEEYGVQEYYEYNPVRNKLRGWIREADQFREIENIEAGWTSPLLGIHMEVQDELIVKEPDGTLFQDAPAERELLIKERQERQSAQRREMQALQREEQAQAQAREEALRAVQAQAKALEEARRAEQAQAKALEEARRAEQAQAKALEEAQRAEIEREQKEAAQAKALEEAQRAEIEREQKEAAQAKALEESRRADKESKDRETIERQLQSLKAALAAKGIDLDNL